MVDARADKPDPADSGGSRDERRATDNLRAAETLAALAVALILGLLANSALLVIDPGLLDLLTVLAGALGMVACLVLVIYVAIVGGERLRSLLVVAVALGMFASLPWWSFRVSWQVERQTWARATRGAQPVIEAIESYTRDRGEPPASLDALVPKYLARVPGTGLIAYRSFDYEVYESPNEELLWYDLGSRNGHPMTGLWVFPDGPPEHAILAFTVADGKGVTDVRADRMPAAVKTREFDAKLWRRGGTARMELVYALPDRLRKEGIQASAVIGELGEPDGRRTMVNTPWELRIDCSHGFGNWDTIIYWPTKDYPEYVHGGSTERVGDWAYVHE